MQSKKVANEPLLYIQQPKIAKPIASMQYDYYTPKHVDQTNENNYSDRSPSEIKSIKFKDMSTVDKVQYLINQPEHVPKVTCLIRTNDQIYKGIIIKFENSEVSIIEEGRRLSSSIPIGEITSIKIIGF